MKGRHQHRWQYRRTYDVLYKKHHWRICLECGRREHRTLGVWVLR